MPSDSAACLPACHLLVLLPLSLLMCSFHAPWLTMSTLPHPCQRSELKTRKGEETWAKKPREAIKRGSLWNKDGIEKNRRWKVGSWQTEHLDKLYFPLYAGELKSLFPQKVVAWQRLCFQRRMPLVCSSHGVLWLSEVRQVSDAGSRFRSSCNTCILLCDRRFGGRSVCFE